MFKDGAMQGNAYVEWGGGASVSMWNATKVIPLTNTSPLGYIWASANFRQAINYTPIGTGARAIDFSLPTSHWWSGSATYDKNVRGIGYVEFNGTCLLGVQNGLSSNGVWSTAYMYPTSRIIPELQQWLMALSSIHVKEVQQEQAVSRNGVCGNWYDIFSLVRFWQTGTWYQR